MSYLETLTVGDRIADVADPTVVRVCIPAECTGWLLVIPDETDPGKCLLSVQHDGPSCPIHEPFGHGEQV